MSRSGEDAYTYSELAKHYPDLFEGGGMLRTLQRIAEERDLDLGAIESDSDHVHATVTADSDRGLIWINVAGERRAFLVRLGSELGFPWAEGWAPSMEEVAEVIDAWRGGIPLASLKDRFPFLEISQRAMEYVLGKSLAESCWNDILADDEFRSDRDMVALLHSRPRIRVLRPEFSHRTLRLFVDPYDRSAGDIRVEPKSDRAWSVWSSKDAEEVYIPLPGGSGYYDFAPPGDKVLADVTMQDLPDAVESFIDS
jgi:hypothetical protein